MLISDCCGASADGNEDYGICPDCKEHCEFIEEESDKELEERTERNMKVISDFCEHVKSEVGLVIPESAVLSFFNA